MLKIIGRYWIAPASWGCALLVYGLTLCPTVYVEGTGELIGAVYFLGTPHPTGYPLFCLIGRLLAVLQPWGSVAYKINLATACSGALAAAALALFLRLRGCGNWSALGAGLAFAFSFTFWSQSVIAEVYGLSILMSVLAMGLGLRAIEYRDERLLLLTSFAMGLGLTAHLNQVLIWPGLLLLLVWRWPGVWRRPLLLGKCLLAGLGGYSLVLYLPVRNGRGRGFHWGVLDTPELLWKHLTAALYRSSFFSMPWEAGLLNAQRWLGQAVDEFHVFLVPLVAWGLWRMGRTDGPATLVAGGALVANLAMALNYHRDLNGLGVFFLLSFVVQAMALGYGLHDVGLRLRGVGGGQAGPIIAALLAVALVLTHNWERAERSRNFIAYQYGADLLRQLPPHTVLIADGDDVSFIVDYLHRVEGMRPDVDLYNRNGRGTDLLQGSARTLVRRERGARQMAAEAELILQGERPIFYLYPLKIPVKGYEFVPAGLCYQVRPEKEKGEWPVADIPFANARQKHFYRDPWVRKIQSNYWYMEGERQRYLGREEAACKVYEQAAEVAYDSRSARFNIGLMMYKYGRLEDAARHVEAARKLDPWKSDPHRLLAHILRRQGKFEQAEILLKKAVDLGKTP